MAKKNSFTDSTGSDAFKGTPRRDWYEYITPLLGIKWGAIVTLIGYVAIYQKDNEGMLAAAAIVGVFTALEWAQMCWNEFKRRAR